MIPVRVRMQGFMSYREEAVLEFDGAPLWMLSGPNGSGKSTVFDAITFALYGLHRGGKQDARELINHERDRLSVEFDFWVGEREYRVKRTLARTNRSSFQAFALPSRGEKSDPKAIAETDQKTGFDGWIKSTLGLDDKTFTASVLLQQGRSDALLEASPLERHKILSQIVELGDYEKLHAKTDARRKDFENFAKLLDSQLQGIEPVDDEEIERLDGEAKAARKEIIACQDRARELAALRVSAAQWMKLGREQKEVTAQLEAAQSTLERASAIESAASRRRELDAVVPHLEKLWEAHARVAEFAARARDAAQEAAQSREKLQQAKSKLAAMRAEIAHCRAERDAEAKKRDEARETQSALAPAIAAIDDYGRRQKQLAALEDELSVFAPDLDAQIAALGDEVEALTELKTVLPWLGQFARARDEWCLKSDKSMLLAAQETGLEEALSALQIEAEAAQKALQNAQTAQQEAQNNQTQARAWLQTAKQQRSRFEQIDGAPLCSLCGQDLDEAHLESERALLDEQIAAHQSTLAAAQEEARQSAQHLATCEVGARDSTQRVRQAENERAEHEAQKREVNSVGAASRNEAKNAFDNLPPEWQKQIHPLSEKFINCLRGDYPRAADLIELQTRAARHTSIARELQSARENQTQRDRKRAEKDSCGALCEEMAGQYPPSHIREIHDAQRDAAATIQSTSARLQELSGQLGDLENRWHETESQRDAAQKSSGDAENLAGQWQARGEQTALQLAELELQTPADWQEAARDLSSDSLSQWREERASLSQALDDWAALETARAQHAPRLARLEHIAVEMAAIPEAARREVSEIEMEAREVGARQSRFETLAQESESEKQELQSRRQRRAEIDGDYHRSEKQTRLHRELAELLGRDRLQRHLLQQAEQAIVGNANILLDRISGGTLRLELKKSDDEAAAKKGKERETKALELVARNTQTSEQAMPVYLLSGSQRFRVAVALALGIGQFAGNSDGQNGSNSGTRRIESVIIDEGFGSLDQEGRREIIEELNNLKNVLSRVILVSHQEEFADAFSNRYHIQLEGGTSVARIVEGD